MTDTIAFSKILHVREKEKLDAQKAYHQSIEFFEEIATQLYTLLRKKEMAEESYEGYLRDTMPLERIKEQVVYIEQLSKKIMELQSSVQQARYEMETKQKELTNAHVEVKKFEKIIEYRQKAHKDEMQKIEKAAMDEISIQQYLSQGFR